MPGLAEAAVYPIEVGLIGLGLMGSLLTCYQIAAREHPQRVWHAFSPWAVLCVALTAAAVWLLSQPMEMRGTFLGA